MRIAIISPGSFSVPPVKGTSVEHDIQMVAEQLKNHHKVVVYAKKCQDYRKSTQDGNLYYKRFRVSNSRIYIKKVLQHLDKKLPEVILVENRPKYVSYIRKQFPHIPIVLNMHSAVYANPPYINDQDMWQVCRQVDALITNSVALKEYFIERFPILSETSHAVHLGIDPLPYDPSLQNMKDIKALREKYGLQEEDRVLLFVGRLLKKKGVHLLLDIFPSFLEKYPNLKLLIAGSPRYGRNPLTKYVKKLKQQSAPFREHIIFTNFIPPDQMPYIFQLADIVVMPSIWNEPFGRVILEAMASGKPIVASNRGGIMELVKHEENGLIFSVENYKEELKEAIFTLLGSDELRNVYIQNGREMAKSYTWHLTADRYVQIFKTLLSDSG